MSVCNTYLCMLDWIYVDKKSWSNKRSDYPGCGVCSYLNKSLLLLIPLGNFGRSFCTMKNDGIDYG